MRIGIVAITAGMAACLTLSCAQPDCADWNGADFFGTASAGDVRACLLAGADPGARDKRGRTPFDRIGEDSPLTGTPAYWRLNDARWN